MKKILLFFLLVTCSFLVFGELAFRLRAGQLLSLANTLTQPSFFLGNRIVAGYPEELDSKLGWRPKTSAVVATNWSAKVTTHQFGIRSNGPQVLNSNSSPILVVGGSFTFGDQVNDDETWPAYLESELGKPVLNAGVSGYGFDQTVLRLESLLPAVRPEMAIVASAPELFVRCQQSVLWGLPKPYFVVENGVLVPKNSPVPIIDVTKPKLTPLQASLGYSHVISKLLYKLAPNFWTQGLNFVSQNEIANPDWENVSCKLIHRLGDLSREQKIPIKLVMQYVDNDGVETLSARKLAADCSREAGIELIDLYEQIRSVQTKEPERYKRLFNWHMTAEGNKFIATSLVSKLPKSKNN